MREARITVEPTTVADAPNRLWLTDITEHPTREGKVYLAVVFDVYSRRAVGWSIAGHLRAAHVVDALEMARWRRRPAPGQTVLHSGRGVRSARPGPSATGCAPPACSAR